MPIQFIVMVSELENYSPEPDWVSFIWGKPYMGAEMPPTDYCWQLLTIHDDASDDELMEFALWTDPLFHDPHGNEDGRVLRRWLQPCGRRHEGASWYIDDKPGWGEQLRKLQERLSQIAP